MDTVVLNRRQFYVALAVLAVSGLLGGALATWLMPGRAAWAQEVIQRGQPIGKRIRLVGYPTGGNAHGYPH